MTVKPRIQLAAVQLFVGPSIAAWHACFHAVLAYDGLAPASLGMLRERLAAFPHALTGARPFAPQLDSEEPAHVFAALAQGLQRAYRHHVSWHQVTPIDACSSEVTVEIMHPESSLPLMELALALTQAAFGLPDAPAWDALVWRGLRDLWPRPSHFYSQDRILAARQMGLHCEVGAGIHRAQYVVGQGRWHRITANAYTASTSHIGKDLAGNKVRARTALARAGLPVPAQCRVASVQDALQQAARMGYPVVLKPSGSRASQGVYTMLTGPDAIERVFPLIADGYGELILEKQVLGHDYRLLVIGSRCIAAAQRLHPTVTGDGRSTVAELSATANVQLGRDGIFNEPVAMDPETLQALHGQGVTPDTVPPVGQTVVLRKAACPASLAQDVTDQLHPSLARLAEQAAAAVQLDMAGIDLVCPDITQPWQGTGTAIVEINAGPAIDVNCFPDLGTPRPVARAMWRTAIPAGQHGNIPVVALVGRYHKQQGAQHACRTLRMAGLDAQTPDALDAPFPTALPAYHGLARAWAGAWLARDEVEALVLPLSWSTLAREGLPVAQHSVAIFTDEDGAFPDLEQELHTPDLQARLYRLVMDASLCGVVYPAASQRLSTAAAHLPACSQLPIAGVEQAGTLPDGLAAHVARGGEAVVWTPAHTHPQTLYWIDAQGQWHLLAQGLHAPHAPPPFDADGLPTLAASLAALRLLGYDLATLRRITALHTGQPPADPTPPVTPWTLQAPSAPTPETRHWLPAIAAHANGPWEVHCHDTPTTRAHLSQWFEQLPARARLWRITPQAAPTASTTAPPVHTQLLSHSVHPALIQAAAAQTAAGWPRIELDDLRSAPVLRGWAIPEPDPPCNTLLWQPGELPAIARAAWVGGPPAAHRACTRLALDTTPDPAGTLIVVPGVADSAHSTADIERRTREAFAQGAWAVMSAVLPPELPRWRPMLQCDDPAAALLALARVARERYRGRLTALLTDSTEQDPPPLEAEPSSLWGTALALAHLSGTAPAAAMVIDWDLPALQLARPDEVVLPHAGPALAQRLRPLLPFLAGITVRVPLQPPHTPAPWLELVHPGGLAPQQLCIETLPLQAAP